MSPSLFPFSMPPKAQRPPEDPTADQGLPTFVFHIVSRAFVWRLALVSMFLNHSKKTKLNRMRLILITGFLACLVLSFWAAQITEAMFAPAPLTPQEAIDISMRIMEDANDDPTGFQHRCSDVTVPFTFPGHKDKNSASLHRALVTAKCLDNTSASPKLIQAKIWHIYNHLGVDQHFDVPSDREVAGIVLHAVEPRVVCLRRIVGQLWKCMINPTPSQLQLHELITPLVTGSLVCYKFTSIHTYGPERMCFSKDKTVSNPPYLPWKLKD